jgi:hypothetical protein
MIDICNAHQALVRRKRGTNLEQSRWADLNYHYGQEYRFGRVVTLEEETCRVKRGISVVDKFCVSTAYQAKGKRDK